METIYLNQKNLADWQAKAKPNVIALGCFDGLHNGHVKVIQTAFEKAKATQVSLAVMSFFPHPKTVIGGNPAFHYLMPQADKEEKLQKLGVDTFYVVEFDKEFAGLSPEDFVTQYLLRLGVVHAVAGYDFSYGSRGAGHMGRLYQDSGEQIEVTTVKKVEYHGEKVSSTSIRERLLSGKVDEIPDLLGHSYEIKGDWDGRNFSPHSFYTLPTEGKYAVTLKSDLHSWDTEAVVNEKRLTLIKEIPLFMIGEVSIEWNQRISVEIGIG